jgi:hypothetical protein
MTISTSSTTKTNTDSAIDNKELEGKEKRSIENETQLIKGKELKFHEYMGWLKKWGYKVIDRSKENNIEGIQFKAEIFPLVPYSSGTNTPFFLEFQNDLDDGFIIRSTFELDKNIELYLKNKKGAREIELTYIQIEQIILPLKISFIRAHPIINIYKIIFTGEELTKQFFFDSINDLTSAMSLIIGKWDEKYYEIKPKIQEEKKIRSKNRIIYSFA